MQIRASTVQHTSEECYRVLQCAAGFHCLVEDWHHCEELQPKGKES